MFIDMHMHEMTYSMDSFLKLDQIVSIAREKGLGAVCITDHDSIRHAGLCGGVFPESGFPHFCGDRIFLFAGRHCGLWD